MEDRSYGPMRTLVTQMAASGPAPDGDFAHANAPRLPHGGAEVPKRLERDTSH